MVRSVASIWRLQIGLFEKVRIAHFLNNQSSGTLVRVQGWTSPAWVWGSAPARRLLATTTSLAALYWIGR